MSNNNVEGMGTGELRTLNGMVRSAQFLWDNANSVWLPATPGGGGLTNTELRASPLAVTGAFFPATQPVSIASMPVTPVVGTFFQATQPVSIAAMPSTPVTGPLTDAQLRAAAIPVSLAASPLATGAATETTVASRLSEVTFSARINTLGQKAMAASTPVVLASDQGALAVTPPSSALAVTATGAAAAAVTLTLPAAVGLKHYINFIEITAYNTAARTGSAAPVIVTTTNLPGSLAFTFASAGAVGTTDRYIATLEKALTSLLANTNTTIVCPATASVIWRINVHYHTAV